MRLTIGEIRAWADAGIEDAKDGPMGEVILPADVVVGLLALLNGLPFLTEDLEVGE